MDSHLSFLSRANAVKLRLEAEGMYSTAEALDLVIGAYMKCHSEELLRQYDFNLTYACSWLTRH